ncbi:hypothetical protein ABEV34_04825 [Methylorubrum rhodesianum]|uniref:hypothetical protein n=1 Tax=Methylorubrum rhodesianum TaxID=29427 RepID=UPI003D2A101D
MGNRAMRRRQAANGDLFDEGNIEGVKVYVERDANGDEWVWLMLHLKGRKEPVGIPFDLPGAAALVQNIGDGFDELKRTRPGKGPTAH